MADAMGGPHRVEIPDGWIARGFRFEVEPTTHGQPARIAQHFGARRFAYNWALGQVKANLDARAADPTVPSLRWSFYDLRRTWNQTKRQVAPWWPACSKEAYASGIADLVAALQHWSDASMAAAPARGPGFPASRAAIGTATGSAFPPARCGWSPTVVTWSFPLSGVCGARRTPVDCSGWSPRAAQGCCR